MLSRFEAGRPYAKHWARVSDAIMTMKVQVGLRKGVDMPLSKQADAERKRLSRLKQDWVCFQCRYARLFPTNNVLRCLKHKSQQGMPKVISPRQLACSVGERKRAIYPSV